MDWFHQSDNLFVDNDSNSLSCDNDIYIENVFLKKQTSLADFEVKMEDFVMDSSDTKSNSKNPSPVYVNDTIKNDFSINKRTTSKIFEVNKERKRTKDIKDPKFSNQDPERSPIFKVENRTSENKSSLSECENNITNQTANLDKAVQIQSNIYTDSELNYIRENDDVSHTNFNRYDDLNKIPNFNENFDKMEWNSLLNNNSCNNYDPNYNLLMNMDMTNENLQFIHQHKLQPNFCVGSNNCICPNNYSCYFVTPFQKLSFSERMKLKRERAKLLLEKKTKREHFKLKEVDDNQNLNSSNSSINDYSHSHNSNNSKSTFQNTKSNKSKNFMKHDSLNYGGYNCNMEMSMNSNSQPQFTKKGLKMLRNRISAQRSRDRKKKEMDDLKMVSQNLLINNCYLKKELENRDKELKNLKENLKLLCANCCSIVKNTNENSKNYMNNDELQKFSVVDSSRRNFTSSLKYSLMAGLFAIICVIGVLSITSNFNGKIIDNNNFQGRILNSIIKNEVLSLENKSIGSELDSASTNALDSYYRSDSIISATSMMLYQQSTSNDLNSDELEIKDNIKDETRHPFTIVKDLNKYIEKKLSVEVEQEIQSELLSRKRNEFLYKMQKKNRETKSGNGFLQKPNKVKDTCFDTQGLSWNIVKEKENEFVQNQLEKMKNDENQIYSGGIILKQDANYNSLSSKKIINSVVPFNDVRPQFENSLIRENIKSMYVRDFLTSDEHNSELFREIFNKLNFEIKSDAEDDEKVDDKTKINSNEDCLYLHMIVPSETHENFEEETKKKIEKVIKLDEKMNSTHFNTQNKVKDNDEINKNTDKKVYYELGCKIFEINKIYK